MGGGVHGFLFIFFLGGLPDHNSHYVKSTVCTLLPSQLSSIIFPTVPFGIFDIAKENNPFSSVIYRTYQVSGDFT